MRPRVLISAYACEPGQGSEPGVGWNLAHQIVKDCEVWVITRANNRSAIEAGNSRAPNDRLHFVYYDLPPWARWWKKGKRGVQLYYYLWQIGIYFVARNLHTNVQFDLAHHVTFGKYWAPSLISLLPVPFVWGPVGGGESAPKAFWTSLGVRGLIVEVFRELARLVFENDPFVRLTVRRSRMTLAKSPETSLRLVRLGAKKVKVFGESAISSEELDWFAQKLRKEPELQSIKFISMGRFLPWKGFALGLQGFAMALQKAHEKELIHAEYWLVGNGPEFRRLRSLSDNLGIAPYVKFWGRLSREDTMKKLVECQVLVHPSLHDSGGWVCLEAMAAGKPVICLDLGGPATQVTDKTGIKVPPGNPAQVIRDIGAAMAQLASDSKLRKQKEESARDLIASEYLWDRKRDLLSLIYKQVTEQKEISPESSRY
jgi:glycosyltransferase involved in cell wall biosynthesis